MAAIKYTTGQKFNHLAYLNDVPSNGNRTALFRCDCGNEITTAIGNVKNGNTKSCGCIRGDALRGVVRKVIVPGTIVGNLTYVREAEWDRYRKCVFLCKCGSETTARLAHVEAGETTSCGCVVAVAIGLRSKTHGHATRIDGKFRPTATYKSWQAMRDRCMPNHKSHPYYFDKGIVICEQWRNSFEKFLEDMGERPSGMTLERIESSGNYEAGNCKWATRKEQANNKASNLIIEFEGEKRTASQWAEKFGTDARLFLQRLRQGWDFQRALTEARHR